MMNYGKILILHVGKYVGVLLKRFTVISVKGLDRPRGFQEDEAPRFQDNRYMKVVRLSALRTFTPLPALYPQEIFLVLISVRE
jgi:hypothetical protein